MDIEQAASAIVDSAIKIHKLMGPGLLESTYQILLTYELTHRGFKVLVEQPRPVRYEGIMIETGYRIDMLVESQIIVENKTVDKLLPIHQAQLLTYLKLAGLSLGFLLNWNSYLMKNGIMRIVNNYDG